MSNSIANRKVASTLIEHKQNGETYTNLLI